ncbi:hypothetical protein EZV62_016019 [Acer yangbiense]|uniref:Uncharacterized protein n=1 Tax=Acer yangbiense TaxID=1000413 RepID=A0A5C7HMF0_9ROSI|nr:hypothetical protein EZV62_016019 [Acer yangbiense]
MVEISESTYSQPVPSDMIISPKKKLNRKWKRSARENHINQIIGVTSSPIQRVLAAKKAGRKSSRCKSSSPPGPKLTCRIGKSKSPAKGVQQTKILLKVEGSIPCKPKEEASCKRKVSFENDEDNRNQKKTNWLEAGDRNSRYFHEKATSRRKKNLIDKLVDAKGSVQSGEDRLAGVIKEYFSTIFKSSSPSNQDINLATSGSEWGFFYKGFQLYKYGFDTESLASYLPERLLSHFSL